MQSIATTSVKILADARKMYRQYI